jgi:hypothetical protein
VCVLFFCFFFKFCPMAQFYVMLDVLFVNGHTVTSLACPWCVYVVARSENQNFHTPQETTLLTSSTAYYSFNREHYTLTNYKRNILIIAVYLRYIAHFTLHTPQGTLSILLSSFNLQETSWALPTEFYSRHKEHYSLYTINAI